MGLTTIDTTIDSRQVPLFPLGTVLFPGGALPLRIFEPRYLTMIGECMKNGSPFGVVLSTAQPSSVEGESAFHEIGTLSLVEDFDQLDDGYLGVSCRGTDRFSVLSHWHQDDHLIVAEVKIIESEMQAPTLPENFAQMNTFLQSLCEREELKDWVKGLSPDWGNGDWLSCRLSELLPLSVESRQALLEMGLTDRLDQLSKVMRENKML